MAIILNFMTITLHLFEYVIVPEKIELALIIDHIEFSWTVKISCPSQALKHFQFWEKWQKWKVIVSDDHWKKGIWMYPEYEVVSQLRKKHVWQKIICNFYTIVVQLNKWWFYFFNKWLFYALLRSFLITYLLIRGYGTLSSKSKGNRNLKVIGPQYTYYRLENVELLCFNLDKPALEELCHCRWIS